MSISKKSVFFTILVLPAITAIAICLQAVSDAQSKKAPSNIVEKEDDKTEDNYTDTLPITPQPKGKYLGEYLGRKATTGTVLGIHVSPALPALQKHLKIPARFGLMIEHVEISSAAAEANLKRFDVLYKLDGQLLANQEQLTALVRMRQPNDQISLTIFRDGHELEQSVILQRGEITDSSIHELELLTVDPSDLTKHTTDPKFQNCQSCHTNSYDQFILRNLRESELSQNEKRKAYQSFYHRIHLDLLGVPASTQEINKFAASNGKARVAKIQDLLQQADEDGRLKKQQHKNPEKLILQMLLSLDE